MREVLKKRVIEAASKFGLTVGFEDLAGGYLAFHIEGFRDGQRFGGRVNEFDLRAQNVCVEMVENTVHKHAELVPNQDALSPSIVKWFKDHS